MRGALQLNVIPMALAFFLLLPVAAVVPRGMPVWLLVSALLAGLSILLPRRVWPPAPPLALAGLAALAVWAAAAALWSPSPRAWSSAIAVIYAILGGLVLIQAVRALAPEERQQLCRVFLAGAALGLGLMIFEILTDHSLHRFVSHVPSDSPVGGNVPKRAAALLAMLAWPVAALVMRRLRPHMGRVGAMALLAGAMILPFAMIWPSRAASAGVAAGMVVLLTAWISLTWTRRILSLLVVIGFLGMVPAGLALPSLAQKTDGWLFASAQQRLDIWHASAQRVMIKPAQGWGTDAARAFDDPDTARHLQGLPADQPVTTSLHPHNGFLQIWMEWGAVGVGVILFLWAALMGVVRLLDDEFQALALGMLACALVVLNTAYGLMQAWWICGHVASVLIMIMVATSISTKGKTDRKIADSA